MNKRTCLKDCPLPMSREEMLQLGWDELDVLFVSGDAYVDHPAYGVALLGRWLQSKGFRVGIVAQPKWASPKDILCMGRPRLFAGVTGGSLDSMLAHYTAFRKKRKDDSNTPGGVHGARPNRASIVYTGLVKQAFTGLPVILGGIEASLRRASHYDFWSDKLRRSILLNSKADLLIYGMGELAILEIATRLAKIPPEAKQPARYLHGIHGTVFARTKTTSYTYPEGADVNVLPSHEEIASDPRKLMQATLLLEKQVHDRESWAIQATGNRELIFAPPSRPLTTDELGNLYEQPFTRRPHPEYKATIPGAQMLQFSITSHRGCGGGCSFCSLTLHQGRGIQSRSEKSIINEASHLTKHPDWKGSISDVGGPSANMWGACCTSGERKCTRTSCLFPEICKSFYTRQLELARLLKLLSRLDGVKHIRVASGVRHDLALRDPKYVRTLVSDFTGGQLKIAPEHISKDVLKLMRKPSFKLFLKFLTVFECESHNSGKQLYTIPYLISAFPGCSDSDMRNLALWLKDKGWKPEQVQCFVPTPGTVATAMYFSGVDPKGNSIYVAKTDKERLRQHQILMQNDHKEKKSHR